MQQTLLTKEAEVMAREERRVTAAPPVAAAVAATTVGEMVDVEAVDVVTTAGETVDEGATAPAVETTVASSPASTAEEGAEEAPVDEGEAVAQQDQRVIDPLEELAKEGISPEIARAATDVLRESLLAAGASERVEDRDEMTRHAIDVFQRTPFGKKSYEWIHGRGWAVVPLFSADDVDDKTRFMAEQVDEGLLYKVSDGHFEIPKKFKVPNINEEKRWMIDPETHRNTRS